MIQEVKFLSMVCDECKELLGDEDENLWSYKLELIENMHGYEWVEIDGKHYCPKCKPKS